MKAKVFANGQGGKHRRGSFEAESWRNATTRAAQDIRMTHPQMCPTVVRAYAEDETARAARRGEI